MRKIYSSSSFTFTINLFSYPTWHSHIACFLLKSLIQYLWNVSNLICIHTAINGAGAFTHSIKLGVFVVVVSFLFFFLVKEEIDTLSEDMLKSIFRYGTTWPSSLISAIFQNGGEIRVNNVYSHLLVLIYSLWPFCKINCPPNFINFLFDFPHIYG